MTSGSWRSALRSAYENDWVSTATSRWLMIDRLSRWRNSIGSSIVMTCTQRVALMWSTIAASVVLLPDPVVPVTSTRPRSSSAICASTPGRPSSSIDLMRIGMTRRTMPIVPRCWKTLQRNRPSCGMLYARSTSCASLNFCRWALDMTAAAIATVSSCVRRRSSDAGLRTRR